MFEPGCINKNRWKSNISSITQITENYQNVNQTISKLKMWMWTIKLNGDLAKAKGKSTSVSWTLFSFVKLCLPWVIMTVFVFILCPWYSFIDIWIPLSLFPPRFPSHHFPNVIIVENMVLIALGESPFWIPIFFKKNYHWKLFYFHFCSL